MNWRKIMGEMNNFKLRLRVFFFLSLLLTVLVFFYLKIVPSGQIVYSRHWPRGLGSGRGFIYDFRPGERLDMSDDGHLRMIGDPLYFSVFTPRNFSSAKVTITYRDRLSGATPIVELGVLKDKLAGSYDLQPLENKIIDELEKLWPSLSLSDSGNPVARLFQTEENYRSGEDFLADLKKRELKACSAGIESCLATYHYSFSDDYHSVGHIQSEDYFFDQPIRGPHQIYLYLPVGRQEISLTLADLNLDPGPDPVVVSMSRSGQEMISRVLPDDRSEVTGEKNAEIDLILPFDSAGGLYKLDIRSGNDIVVSSLRLPSDQFVFINRFWPAQVSGGLRLFTDSAYLQVKAFNADSLGIISYGGQARQVSATHQQLSFHSDQGVSEIYISRGDPVLEVGGVLALTEQTLFNPAVKKVDRFFQAGKNIKYVVAAYEKPVLSDGLKKAVAEFNLSGAQREDGKYTFLVSVPGLGAATPDSFLEIHNISVELVGLNIWQKIKTMF